MPAIKAPNASPAFARVANGAPDIRGHEERSSSGQGLSNLHRHRGGLFPQRGHSPGSSLGCGWSKLVLDDLVIKTGEPNDICDVKTSVSEVSILAHAF